MNIKQIERIRTMIKSIRAELQTDSMGTSCISIAVGELWQEVTNNLKNEVWLNKHKAVRVFVGE